VDKYTALKKKQRNLDDNIQEEDPEPDG
jgi:hypothetical protein